MRLTCLEEALFNNFDDAKKWISEEGERIVAVKCD